LLPWSPKPCDTAICMHDRWSARFAECVHQRKMWLKHQVPPLMCWYLTIFALGMQRLQWRVELRVSCTHPVFMFVLSFWMAHSVFEV
jgi:hypothetical protein